MSGIEMPLRQLRRQIYSCLLADEAVTLITIWMFFWGSLAVFLRLAFNIAPRPLLWGALGLMPVVIASVWITRRRLPSDLALRAAIDAHSKAGGLFMAEAEIDVRQWSGKRPPLNIPRFQYHAGKPLFLLSIATVFVLAALVIPEKYTQNRVRHTFDLDNATANLEHQIELLADEELMPNEETQELAAELARVREEAAGEDPAGTWAALDHLQERVENAAQEAAESQVRAGEALSQAQALSEALSEFADGMPPGELAESLGALQDLIDKAQSEAAQMLSPELQELLKELGAGTLTAATLSKMAQQLSVSAEDLAELAKRLQAAGLIDAELAAKCNALSQADIDAMLAALRRGLDDDPAGAGATHAALLAAATECAGGNAPGRGGVSRGRGDAAMTWTDGSNEENVSFTEHLMPPGAIGDIRESMTIGISATAPEVFDGEVSAAPRYEVAPKGSGITSERRLLPRHRNAVKAYFERTE